MTYPQQPRPPYHPPQYGTGPYPQQRPTQYDLPMQRPYPMQGQPPKRGMPTWGWVLIFGAIAAAGVMVVLVFFTNVFAATPVVTEAEIQQGVQSLADDNGAGEVTKLQCPKMEAVKGATYTCLAEVDSGQISILVTIQDDEGAYLVEVEQS